MDYFFIWAVNNCFCISPSDVMQRNLLYYVIKLKRKNYIPCTVCLLLCMVHVSDMSINQKTLWKQFCSMWPEFQCVIQPPPAWTFTPIMGGSQQVPSALLSPHIHDPLPRELTQSGLTCLFCPSQSLFGTLHMRNGHCVTLPTGLQSHSSRGCIGLDRANYSDSDT